MSLSDPQDLVQRAARRDPDAFAELYEDHVDRVFRYVFFRVGEGLAEELTAEIFSKAWEGIESFQWRNLPFQNWLLRIARNTVIDYWRGRRRPTSPIEEHENMMSDETPPDELVTRDMDIGLLRDALLRLPDEQRDVVILRFIEGYSHKDTADVVGKSEVAVRQIQVRALRALRKLLEESGEEFGAIREQRPARALPRREPEPS